jgi:ATP-binding cassette, subfamily B, multidrug efflux pump
MIAAVAGANAGPLFTHLRLESLTMSGLQRDEQFLGRSHDLRIIRRMFHYMLPYKGYAFAAFVLLMAGTPLVLIGPPLMQVAIDLYLAPDPARPATGLAAVVERAAAALGLGGSSFKGIVFLSLIFLAGNLATLVVTYFQNVLLQRMGQFIMRDMRQEVFARLQRLPIQFHDRNPVGRLMTRLTTDVDALNEMFTSGFINVFGDVAMAVYIITYLLMVNWQLALVTLLVFPLLIWLTVWFRRGTRVALREARIQIARLNAFLQEHLTGMTIVQLFNREATEMRKFAGINQALRDTNVKAVFYYAFFNPAVEVISAVGIALVLWYGGGQVIGKVATVGMLIAFIQLTRSFYEPVAQISDKYNIIQAAITAAERVFNLLDEPVTITSPSKPVRLPQISGRIEFRNVWFAYGGDDWILKDVSFTLEPGERVALVGHTGAGKTTIINLLIRFYDIQRGQILLDGIDIRDMDLAELRSKFGVVLQDVFLFSGDLASNIRLGNASISDEQLLAASRQAHADAFINRLPDGYATDVRERGARLSFGQRQLISFARALAFDPAVLILDEATSSVDPETEHLIGSAVERLLNGRTSLVIAHRLATIQAMDKIIVLHKGEVREVGTHGELLLLGGLYRRLQQLHFAPGY